MLRQLWQWLEYHFFFWKLRPVGNLESVEAIVLFSSGGLSRTKFTPDSSCFDAASIALFINDALELRGKKALLLAQIEVANAIRENGVDTDLLVGGMGYLTISQVAEQFVLWLMQHHFSNLTVAVIAHPAMVTRAVKELLFHAKRVGLKIKVVIPKTLGNIYLDNQSAYWWTHSDTLFVFHEFVSRLLPRWLSNWLAGKLF